MASSFPEAVQFPWENRFTFFLELLKQNGTDQARIDWPGQAIA
jgi:hypothetical protein